MTMHPAGGLLASLDVLVQRVRWRGWIGGAGAGSLVGGGVVALLLALLPGPGAPLLLLLAPFPLGILAGAGVGAFLVEARFRREGGARVSVAREAELRIPESRNLVRTAAEEEEGDHASDPLSPVLEEILREAGACLGRNPAPRVIPLAQSLRRATRQGLLALLLLGGGWWVGSHAASPASPHAAGEGHSDGAGAPFASSFGEEGSWYLVVEPPAYRGEGAAHHASPLRVRALEGSRVRFLAGSGKPTPSDEEWTPDGAESLPAGLHSVRLETARGVQDPAGFELHPDDAYLLLSGEGFREHLVALEVEADPLPQVEVRLPGRDLHLPDGRRVLEVMVEAEDDHALDALELRFLKVTGFGERWSFEEGVIPLEVERVSPSLWRGQARWDLAPLELLRGEAVVYRARARDRRPEGGWGSSESWTVEIQGGGGGEVGGFAGDDETTRYALSQQVVLALTEALEAGADTLTPDALLEEARTLAAAQRRVRAEFVFMLGGELEDEHLHGAPDDDGHHDHDHDHPHDHDTPHPPPPGAGDGTRTAQELHEEAHARADADAAEGRLAQAGRIELGRAIQWMAAAATFLDAGALPPALEAEREALEHLQRAFSASRYILRALPERELPDPERRLTGDASGVTGVRLASPPPRSRDWIEAMEGLLSELHVLGLPEEGRANPVPSRASLAAELLRLAGEAPELRAQAPRLLDPQVPLGEIVAAVADHLARALPEAPPAAPTPHFRVLLGRWNPDAGASRP